MFKKILPLIATMFLTSCAIITNTKKEKIFIRADRDSTFVCLNYDTSTIYQLPATIILPRSRRDITVIAINDTLQRKVIIPSRRSGKSIVGNLWLWPLIILDTKSIKSYTYQKHTTVSFDNAPYPYLSSKNWLDPEKNLIRFKLGLPILNLQKREIAGEDLNIASYPGFSIGTEYYFTKKHSINVDVLRFVNYQATKYKTPDRKTHYSYHSTFGLDLQFGSDYKRFHFDTGISYSKTLIYYQDNNTSFGTFQNPKTSYKPRYEYENINLALSAYWRMSGEVNVGMNYYPSMISTVNGESNSKYSHLISFEVIYAPDIFRPSKYTVRKNGNKTI